MWATIVFEPFIPNWPPQAQFYDSSSTILPMIFINMYSYSAMLEPNQSKYIAVLEPKKTGIVVE